MPFEPSLTNEQYTGSSLPPVAAYTSIANPNYALLHSLPNLPNVVPITPTPGFVAPVAYPSMMDNRFTTNPNYPLPPGSSAGEVIKNSEAKSLFNHINTANQNISSSANGMPFLTFKSDRDRMKYIEASYALRRGYTPVLYTHLGTRGI